MQFRSSPFHTSGVVGSKSRAAFPLVPHSSFQIIHHPFLPKLPQLHISFTYIICSASNCCRQQNPGFIATLYNIIPDIILVDFNMHLSISSRILATQFFDFFFILPPPLVGIDQTMYYSIHLSLSKYPTFHTSPTVFLVIQVQHCLSPTRTYNPSTLLLLIGLHFLGSLFPSHPNELSYQAFSVFFTKMISLPEMFLIIKQTCSFIVHE